MLAGVDFNFQAEPDDGRQLGFETIGERGTTRANVALGLAEPWVQALSQKVQCAADGFFAKLDEVEIFGIAGRGLEDDFLEGGAATEEQASPQDWVGVNLHQASGENEVLLHLGR